MKPRAAIGLFGMLIAVATPGGVAPSPRVATVEIREAIGPATAGYINRAIRVAEEQSDDCLVIELDTPGGLVDSTMKIVASFYASKVPIVVYVAPAPARAGSAGAFITMAADVAAMAPFTRIGAAHPVNIGSSGEEEKTDDVMKKKIENDTASFAESIARKRHRNVEWARSAVLQSSSITAEQALDKHVIDLIADDLPALLKQLEGRNVGSHILHTAGATLEPISMTFGERFLQLFLEPEMMFVLMLVVIYGIIGELSSPGAILPGVAGAIALVIVLCMSAILPVNAAGLVLVGLALVLFIIDLYAPTHGVLTIGGIVAFFIGALMLFDRSGPFPLSLPVVFGGTGLTALFFLFVVGAGLKAQRLPVRAGAETMLGKVVTAAEPIDATRGRVFVEGEYWNAVSDSAVDQNQPVEIVAVEGLTLKVKPRQ